MCLNVWWWWWILLLVIVMSGAFGGLVGYFLDQQAERETDHGKKKNASYCTKSLVRYVVIGVGSALLVPLFLNTISSELLAHTEKDSMRVFLLIGFCLAAAIFSRRFIQAVSVEALRLVQSKAEHAEITAESALSKGISADNRALAVVRPMIYIEQGHFQRALDELQSALLQDPENAEAWAWKGYCLRRLERVSDAIEAMEMALRMEGRDVFNWLYNLACYRTLNNSEVAAILAILERARKLCNKDQAQNFKKELQEDVDFAKIRDDKDFQNFVRSL